MTAPSSHALAAAAIVHALVCGQCAVCDKSAERGSGLTHCPVPGHVDKKPSFSVGNSNQTTLVHCFGGCSQEAVIAALREQGLWSKSNSESRQQRRWREHHSGTVTRWPYLSEEGDLLACHCRRDLPGGGKTYWWERPDGTISRAGESNPVVMARLPLYRLPDLLRKPLDTPIYLCEGEKAADAARAAGLSAVALPGGANQRDFGAALAALTGRRVVLWPDQDKPGRQLMHAVAEALVDVAAQVRWLEPPDLPPKGDAADYFAAGRSKEALAEWTTAPTASSAKDHEDENVPEANSLMASDEDPIATIPPLPSFARLSDTVIAAADDVRGVWLDPFLLAVSAASPRTPYSLLEACGLFALSLAVARRCFVRTGSKQVYAALYLLFVGRSTTRAKTTALEVLRQLLTDAGLADLLLPGRFSTQALAMDLALWVHKEVREGSPAVQEQWLEKHRHAAARGIIRDEVSGLFDDCSKDYNAGLLPFLLELDGAPSVVDPPLTISRGEFRIENAGINLLGATTPAALQEHASQGYHWRNGLFGRFGLIAADEDSRWAFWQTEPFPAGVVQDLRRLYDAFARPFVQYQYGETELNAKGEEKPPRIIGAVQQGYVAIEAAFTPAAWDLYAGYDRALFALASQPRHPEQMDPTYGRLPGLAVRLALAFACCRWAIAKETPAPLIDLGEWAAAQEITERWRADAHRILSAALDADAQEATSADIKKLMELLANGAMQRGDALQSLKWTAARLTLAVSSSGGRVVEERRRTNGRPALWLTRAEENESGAEDAAADDDQTYEEGAL